MVEESDAKMKVLPGKIRLEKQDRLNKMRICICRGVFFICWQQSPVHLLCMSNKKINKSAFIILTTVKN